MRQIQEQAIRRPCRFAFETTRPGIAFVTLDGRRSVVLTVNSGYE